MKNKLANNAAGKCIHCKYLLLGWTLAIAVSLGWNLFLLNKQTVEQARIEARTIFAHNMAYRKWNTMRGGVYVKLDNKTKPNPYLEVEDRDLRTENGVQLTMINPFQMTREAYALLQKESPLPVYNRTVSSGYLNPENEPDSWEDKALDAFDKGNGEVSEVIALEGKPYMRLIRPYITHEGCLKCHGFQGYDVGDIRGGMSISVPMKPYYIQEKITRKATILTHLALLLFGLCSIILLTRNIQRHQLKISESEKKFRVLAESATDWEYWVSDEEGIIFMSPSCEEITGYSRKEFQDNPKLITRIIHEEDKNKYLVHSSTEQENMKAIEIRITAKNGDIRWLSHAWRSVYIDGVIMGRRISNRDITTQKQLENQLYQAQKMEAIGSLTGGIAHDFNNILTAILGYSLLALRQLPEQSPLKKNIEAICHAGEKAAGLTRQLLAFSRKQVLKMQPIELGHTVHEMQGMINRLIGEDIDFKIVNNSDNTTVMADRSQLDQVVLNLAVNAGDAMPEGGVLSIELDNIATDNAFLSTHQGAKAGEYVQLKVSDTGTGMTKEVQEKIFEPFYTTKEAGKGTGLGLATVYGIVKQHKGYIYVQSNPGYGTEFKILLPATHKKRISPSLTEEHEMFSGRETILVVDDEPIVRDLINHALEPLGYTLLQAPCASDAIKYVMSRGKSIDLLLTDVVMPGMNGHELAEAISGISNNIKVLYMSGHSDNVITRQGQLKDGINYIAKPFKPEALAKEIRRILDD